MFAIRQINFSQALDRSAFCELLNHYAMDPMGGGEALSPQTLENVCGDLQHFPGAVSFLAEIQKNDQPAGLINCFLSYSTFKAKPILNIHDLMVHSSYRSQGIGKALLSHAQAHAKKIGCCKMTLEVLTGNQVAIATYCQFGFENYQLQAEMGSALFMQKWL